MTQRNYQNARNQGDGPKGTSRKSASSAKIKRNAGASVYTPSKAAKAKAAKAKSKQAASTDTKTKDAAEQTRRRERAMVSMMHSMPEYKFWRRIWWVLMGLAMLIIAGTWLPRMLISNGVLAEDFSETANWISNIGFIFAFAALIAAFYIDFRKIRKLQRSQENKARNLTKSERRELDAAIDEAAARDAQRRQERKAKMPWAKKKQQDAADGVEETEAPDKK